MPVDLPPSMHERVVCSIQAAIKYDVPANLVLAVAETEGGKPGQWVRNTNGTHDVGYMQFNTSYLATQLARYGITAADVAASGCYAFELATWRLRGHLQNDQGDLWTRAANYHSRTPQYNTIYRAKLLVKAAKWESWLRARFDTFERGGGGANAPARATFNAASARSEVIAHPMQASLSPAGYVPRSIVATAH